MNSIVKTVNILRSGTVVRINESDYDAERDGSVVDDAGVAAGVAIVSDDTGGNAGAAGNNGGGEPPVTPAVPTAPAANPEPTTAAAPVQMLVTAKGKKFIVVDAAGEAVEHEKIDSKGYATENDAWVAIVAATSPDANNA